MRRILSCLLVLALLFSLCACKKPVDQNLSSGSAGENTSETAGKQTEDTAGNTTPTENESTAPSAGDTTVPSCEESPTPSDEEATTPSTEGNTDTTTPTTPTETTAPVANGCSHSFSDATCTKPKTCTTCGATEGKATGHDWQAATCTKPKTCANCRHTNGPAAGHKWEGATCSQDGVCTVCGIIGGKEDHEFVILKDRKATANFAGCREMKCSVCDFEKTEYYTNRFVFDLDAIAEEIAEYARELGYQAVIDDTINRDRYFRLEVRDLDKKVSDPDILLNKGKTRVKNIYEDMLSLPFEVNIPAHTIHINIFYANPAGYYTGIFEINISYSS